MIALFALISQSTAQENNQEDARHSRCGHVECRNRCGVDDLRHIGGFVAQDTRHNKDSAKENHRQIGIGNPAGDHLRAIGFDFCAAKP